MLYVGEAKPEGMVVVPARASTLPYNDKMVCVDIETGKVADSSSGGGKGKGKKSGQDFF